MTIARMRLDVVAALLAVAASVWVACPCAPASMTWAPGEHSCCPDGDVPALSAPAADCCTDRSLGATVAAQPTAVPLAPVGPAVADSPLPALDIRLAIRTHVPLPFAAAPPSVLRI